MGVKKINHNQICIPIEGNFKEIKFSPEEEIELKLTKINGKGFLIITRN